ncbi:MAG: SH3 domain-containing protein [Thermodesulfobacteriota bacterium]
MTSRKIRVTLAFLLALSCFPALVSGGERLAVSAPTANIRNGPGTNFDVIWQVEQYYPVTILEKKDNWYKVQDFEGDIGWLHQSLLDKTATVIVKNENTNVRSAPGTDSPVIFRVNKGVPFKCLQTQGDWIYIRHVDGDEGWIHRSLVW